MQRAGMGKLHVGAAHETRAHIALVQGDKAAYEQHEQERARLALVILTGHTKARPGALFSLADEGPYCAALQGGFASRHGASKSRGARAEAQ
jgi:hypothetical protein